MKRSPRRFVHPARRQRGAALLTAMIIVTLVTTLAAAMVWQQWRAVQVEAAERARSQAAWILSGGRDFASLFLMETVKPGKPTLLTDPWARPLAESRLSTFLAADKANAGDGPEAFLSGHITDAQSRYNLNNLVAQGKVDPLQLAILARLCESVGVEAGVASRIANGLRDASVTSAASAASGAAAATATPLLPRTLAQLSWLGVDAASIQSLRPHVTLLPAGTLVNVNTASRTVLAAIGAPAASGVVGTSSYFEVNARLRLGDRVLDEQSLVQREPRGGVKLLRQERIASVESIGP